MKKLVIAFGFLLFLPHFQAAEAEVVNYWDYWRANSKTTQQYQANTRRTYTIPRRSTTTRTTSTPRTTRNSTTNSRSRWMNYLRSKYSGRTTTSTATRTTPNYSRSNTSRTTSFVREGVRASVTPITLRQDVNDITAAPVDLFRVGLSHNAAGSDYTEAVYINEMQFQITDNTGVVSDFSDFALVTEDQDFDFDSRGFVTLRFLNLRLARSESRALDISIKIDEPDNFPRLPGSFRVKMTDVTAYREFSEAAVDVEISGRSVSNYVVLNPRGSVSGGGTSTANIYTSQTVVGRSLGGNEKAFLMTLSLNASLDDFLLESLSVTNQHGSNADQLISRMNLINLSTGEVIDTTQFVNGRATFDPNRSKQLYIARNTRAKLGIEAQIVASPRVDNIDNRLTLLLNSDDIELFGVGAGQEVPDNRKTVSVDSETFTVSKGTLTAKGGIYFSSDQPRFFTTGALNQVALFKVVNAGSRDVSFGRFTLQVVPNGTAFTAGGIASDFQLVEIFNGVTEFPRFTVSNVSGNTVTFDATSEVYVDGGQTREFALKVALDNTGSANDSDGVSVVILGDAGLTQGTLGAVRGAGARFIWSDHSGSPHTASSNDWFSGFQFSGVPTNAFVNTRR